MPGPAPSQLVEKPGASTDLALTLPVFLAYHLGVVFLNLRNAADPVTGLLLRVAEGNVAMYLLLTLAVGVVIAGFFAATGGGETFRARKFVQIIAEGAIYALLMGLATTHLIGKLFAGKIAAGGLVGIVLSFGAGFYEELAFRVLLFGLGAKVLVWALLREKVSLLARAKGGSLSFRAFVVMAGWSLVSAAAFSGVHYVGAYSDPFQLSSFTFRLVLGLLLTLIYAARGFAAAVWTHALYDVWVLSFP